ncbi:major facilitator superfamily domain-containing protein [Macrophomina phaseolina]|uniref:Major facilitator superfamily domain-containing protein n=1 Tax=Macrophomina phaseolina TaxID=35725 RepID=A0ABQ8FTN6_9PEZI|nr:major facilitator superfamily domain-containing protein [Macrophomina phaseolina]
MSHPNPSSTNGDLEKNDATPAPSSDSKSELGGGDDGPLVTWDGPNDPHNPQNFSFGRKILITSIWVAGNLATCFASSIYSSGSTIMKAEFHTSTIVTTLGISLFIVGYTVGPPCWGPLSERFGRKWPATLGMLLFTIFCIPVALAQNIETALVGRFLSGVFGAAPLAIVGGGLVDIWNPVQRGVALAACISTIFGGPIIAPVMGNFVAASHLGWRWNHWLMGIFGLAVTGLYAVVLPETHAPTLLRKKAARVREETGNPRAHSQFDNAATGVKAIVQIYLLRSFKMLFTEPILLLITVYQAFIYGILYLIFVAYPIAFREVRHWALGVSGLAYLGMSVGVLLGAAIIIVHTRTRFAAKVQQRSAEAGRLVVIPENRLSLMFLGGCLIPVGLFIFGWTSRPDIHWAGQIVGSIPMAMGMYMVFVQCFNYIIDVYMSTANSAIGANTFVRSFFGAGFPLFGPALYHRLGVDWASSLLAFIAIAMVPIPVLFYKFGHRIRLASRTAENKN